MSTPPALITAIILWKRGQQLPIDLETKLMSLGYDVPALETRYSR